MAILKLLDFLLSVKAKRRLNDVALAAWNWLDDQAHGGFHRTLWHSMLQVPLFLIAGTFTIFANVTALPLVFLPEDAPVGLLMILVVLLATAFGVAVLYRDHRAVFEFLASARTTSDYFSRLMSFVVGFGWPWPAVFAFLTCPYNSPAVTAFGAAALLTRPRRFLHSTALGIIAIESLAWLAVIRTTQAITYFAAYLFRRILEDGKGVLIGSAALIGAVAALLEVLFR